MNAQTLARNAYSPTAAPIRTNRGTEYEAFAKITHKLQSVAKKRPDIRAVAAAIHDNRRLWTLLATDVQDEGNLLPAKLRAQIMYLFEFTQQHSRKVLAREATVDVLIDINTAIMRGLRSNGSGMQ